jgi:hypothetical protein
MAWAKGLFIIQATYWRATEVRRKPQAKLQVYYLVINPVGGPCRAILDHDREYLESYVKECEKEKHNLPVRYYIFEEKAENRVKL